MRILIAGAGIAGLTATLALRRRGHDVVVVDKAPQRRRGGFMIDFFGPGYRAAERLGLLEAIRAHGARIEQLCVVSPQGTRRFCLSYAALASLAEDSRVVSIMRGDLESVLVEALGGDASIRFGCQVSQLREDEGGVSVTLSDGSVERCDLLVGADGLHSRVRALAFPAEDRQAERYLGYHVAAGIVAGATPGLAADGAMMMAALPGRQATLYPVPDGRLAALYVHRAAAPVADRSPSSALAEVTTTYADFGGPFAEVIARHEHEGPLYFDSVSQIVMERWSRGRVMLLGDACWCVSLVAGQGASLAIAGGCALAEELDRGDAIDAALARTEARLRPLVHEKQAAGRSFAGWFVPATKRKLALRDGMLRLATWGPVAALIKRQVAGAEDF